MTIYRKINFDYLIYTDSSYRKIIQEIFNHISNNRTAIKVLELGCGTGAFTRFFLECQKCFVDGIDISRKMLDIASALAKRKRYRDRLKLNEDKICRKQLEKLNIGQYDIIFAGAFMHHLNKEELRSILGYLDETLSNGQLFAAFEPNLINPAIHFQYIYETLVNRSHYDKDEFPLNPYQLTNLLKTSKINKILFLDVDYRSIPETQKRQRVLRYGVFGRVVYAITSRIFGNIYSFLKTIKFQHKYKKDYFLLLSKY